MELHCECYRKSGGPRAWASFFVYAVSVTWLLLSVFGLLTFGYQSVSFYGIHMPKKSFFKVLIGSNSHYLFVILERKNYKKYLHYILWCKWRHQVVDNVIVKAGT